MSAASGFRDVLQAAVADLAEHGYDSEDRVEGWLLRLRFAAEREVGGLDQIDAETRATLDAIYQRLVVKGGVSKFVPDVQRYTLEMVRPQLRAELDRRIMASADLIKLRKAETVNKTVQRFSGWATSIPAGGSSDETRTEVKKRVGKELAQYKFERRRVAIDQGMKLSANVAEIVATDNGAIAGVWVSHWRRAGYNYRQDHKAFDGKIFLVRDSWAMKEGLIKLAGGMYIDDVERPAQKPFCSCNYTWITSPRRLPEDMLTARGREWVKAGKAGVAA
jgi:hypothetical protein